MKSKVLIFIIGLLIGAIITSAGFMIYINANKGKFDGDRPKMERSRNFDKDSNFNRNENSNSIPDSNEDKANNNESKSEDITNNQQNTANT